KFSLATAFHRTAFISRRTKAAYYQYCGQSQNWIMSAHIAASTQGLTTAVRWRYLAWTRVNLELGSADLVWNVSLHFRPTSLQNGTCGIDPRVAWVSLTQHPAF